MEKRMQVQPKCRSSSSTNAGVTHSSGPLDLAPPRRLLKRLGMTGMTPRHLLRTAVAVAAITWFPLLALTFIQDGFKYSDDCAAFLSDPAVHARFLLAAPLLVAADAFCAPRLGRIIRELLDQGVIGETDRARYMTAVASTRKLARSMTVELLTIVMAYAIVGWVVATIPADLVPSWYQSSPSSLTAYPWAAWWHSLVSLPLLLSIILGWLWRLALWTRFLVLMSRLDLRLVTSHPDHAGGIAFVGISMRAYGIVALAVSTLLAGPFAKHLLIQGASPSSAAMEAAVVVALVMALFAAPLFVLGPSLMRAWWHGRAAYEGLARRMGGIFEAKWLNKRRIIDEGSFKHPDFSTLTDFYSIASNAASMRFLPIDMRSTGYLFLCSSAPFFAVAAMTLPVDVLAERIREFLL